MGVMNQVMRWILFFLSCMTCALFAEEKLLSLPEATRRLQIEEKTASEVFLCLMENKKVFGKNPAQTAECYSLKEQDLVISLETFLAIKREAEAQAGFYTSEGKQVFPSWDENGQRFILFSFVINMKSQLFVQVLKKDSKAYYYLRTLARDWEVEK
jgi:hypothetical protein